LFAGKASKKTMDPVQPPTRPVAHQQVSGPFVRLPGTRIEGERVASLLGVSPILGGTSTKSRIANCDSPRILHIATHGFFLEFRPDRQFAPPELLKAYSPDAFNSADDASRSSLKPIQE